MRGLRVLLLLGLGSAGCLHGRPAVPTGPTVEEYALPPHEPRFDNPPPPVAPQGPKPIKIDTAFGNQLGVRPTRPPLHP